MFTYCVRRLILKNENMPKTSLDRIALALQRGRDHSSAAGSHAEDSDRIETLLKLCTARFYIASGQVQKDSFQRGAACVYGPLGMELRKNILEQWWNSVVSSRAQVFGISTLHTSREGPFKVVDSQAIQEVLNQRELSKDQLVQQLNMRFQSHYSARTSLLQGALEQYVSLLELVNRRLPFGLAEAGLCLQPSDAPGCPAEVTQSSLAWFCSPRTSSQWLDYWARQRLQWWRKFALGPSDFSSGDVTEEELGGGASRGVKIVYGFPWGPQPLETLLSLGDTQLLQTHGGSRTKLHCRDGRKSVVPHVLSVTGNMDRGLLAYMYNSLQQVDKVDSKQKLLQRKVLKLHPVLAPVKVALDMGRGATVERRQVCEGLLQEFLEDGISAWPGYLEAMPSSLEQLNTKYDEMGVLFSVVIGENTLESGLVQVRSRDTTVKETMHISEVKDFVSRYISAADNI
ncbi:DNA polymerase subunit gamma-2, mitochondrial [Hypomesus transpacificus]|uniref:DNA polymerase subunit gamma-2, mitochondrial n=1 Tax=Hypomesus transpacificus TaxID=137520 RepID=UPI001F07BBB4|nr:DNA polymerase subunit gamma-2, mitochondrial [Hypomesus transpacificus]